MKLKLLPLLLCLSVLLSLFGLCLLGLRLSGLRLVRLYLAFLYLSALTGLTGLCLFVLPDITRCFITLLRFSELTGHVRGFILCSTVHYCCGRRTLSKIVANAPYACAYTQTKDQSQHNSKDPLAFSASS